MPDKEPKLQIVDNPAIVSTYANKFIAARVETPGAISVTLGELRFLPPRLGEASKQGDHTSVHVVARLALSQKAAIELSNILSQMLVATGVKKVDPQPMQQPSTH